MLFLLLCTALESAAGGMTKKQRRRYQGVGGFTETQIETAHLLIKKVLSARTQGAPYFKLGNSQVRRTMDQHLLILIGFDPCSVLV
jgi:hypothetical protein